MNSIRNVHVGKPPADFPFEDRVIVHIHGFDKMDHAKGERICSPKFKCVGYEWELLLYPNGLRKSEDGMIGVYLHGEGPSHRVANYDVVLKTASGDNFDKKTLEKYIDFPRPHDKGHGWPNVIEREKILDPSKNILNNGTLTFEVCIRLHKDYYCRDVKPRASLGEDILKLLVDEDGEVDKESADVVFEVQGGKFYAHQLILRAREPAFADLFDFCKEIPIGDVDPDIFRTMLMHIYGKEVSVDEWKSKAKSILEASGKYGLTDLKSEAEAWYVKCLKLEVGNVVGEFLYADGKNCSLLKKAAMDFILEHGEEVTGSDSYKSIDASPQLRMEVLLRAFSCSRKRKREE